ncbi:hypothetical protein ACGFK1_20870 [Mycobacterium sp. NPDC048908]|uniref:hypothetical protein n=1 Tax=Mycobacterium sp. NPDC048908 TaxID=3364292 RepID=UPI0037234088
MPAICADLAVADDGRRDAAIDELREPFTLHLERGVRLEIGCTGEALVTLLLDRAAVDDFAEAHRLIDEWPARRPDVPAADLWWLKSRAMLAAAERLPDAYAESAREYLWLCETLDARGSLAEARRMVDTGRLM